MNDKNILTTRFNEFISKIEALISGWRETLLSIASKITLKLVILALSVYLLTNCRVLKSITDKLDKLIRNFL